MAGPNDHPSTPTFLQLYRMLSVYSLIKPPRSGNCTIFEGKYVLILTINNDLIIISDKYKTLDDASIITVSDLKDIINDPSNSSLRIEKIENLKQKINVAVEKGCWDIEDIFLEHNYADSSVFDCVVYYLAG